MFPLLTKYLIQYKRVCIPHIGTFEIVQQSPHLDFADKQISAPSFRTNYIRQDNIPEHQVHFFTNAYATGREGLREELFSFGQKLKNKVRQGPVSWNGFGTLRYMANELVFEPYSMQLDSLQLIPAKKVIRQDAEHHMLVGDRQMSSGTFTHSVPERISKKPVLLIIGWVVVLLALIAIILLLYINGFETGATGLKLPAN